MSKVRRAQCKCGNVSFGVPEQPVFRMHCHCSICRRFNDAPMSDMLIFGARDVDQPGEGAVEYQTYRPPPNVQRGKCATCAQPAIELFRFPLLPGIVMVPSGMVEDVQSLAPPACHVFYASRQQDADDDLPRYSGYLSSQLAFFKYFFFPSVWN